MSDFSFDGSEIIVRFFKYILEGLAVAVAAYFIPGRVLAPEEIVLLGLIAAAVFAVLDLFAPSIGTSARLGSGFAIGASVAGGLGGAGPMIH